MNYLRQTLVLMGLMLSLSQWLSSCSFARWKTVYAGTYNGTAYVLQEREEKGFSTNHIDYRVRLGDLPAAEITPGTTDWGPPYSNDIFGASPYCYTAPTIPAYQNEPDSATQAGQHKYALLYLSPKTFSRADYDQYCGFMKNEWPTIDSLYAEKNTPAFRTSSGWSMPGKRLFLDTIPHSGGLTMATIRTFKNDHGRSPDMDFQIIEQHP